MYLGNGQLFADGAQPRKYVLLPDPFPRERVGSGDETTWIIV